MKRAASLAIMVSVLSWTAAARFRPSRAGAGCACPASTATAAAASGISTSATGVAVSAAAQAAVITGAGLSNISRFLFLMCSCIRFPPSIVRSPRQ